MRILGQIVKDPSIIIIMVIVIIVVIMIVMILADLCWALTHVSSTKCLTLYRKNAVFSLYSHSLY